MALIAALVPPTVVAAATRQVPTDHPTIQACIDAAVSGEDECVVAPGTYNETINFLGKAITVRSSHGRDVTTIDATGIGGSVVTCASGEGTGTVLDGFTITGGTGTIVEGDFVGGGMRNVHASPTVMKCTFSENTAFDFGGGIDNQFGSPSITDCQFIRNSAHFGGGFANEEGSTVVSGCTFVGNFAAYGGGIAVFSEAPLTVAYSTFRGNRAASWGGAVAFLSVSKDHAIHSTQFVANTAFAGGAIYNCSYGLTLDRCTVTANSSGLYAGAIHNSIQASAIIAHTILWGDSPVEVSNQEWASVILRFSDLQGDLPIGTKDDGGNLYVDPAFVRPPSPGPDSLWDGVDDDYGDLRLQPGSPCINAGDPDFVPSEGETDLDGHARVLCGRVDMGAYEFGIGDYDCDQSVDLFDFAGWEMCVTGPLGGPYDPGCEAFDFDFDGDVDLQDWGGFQAGFTGE